MRTLETLEIVSSRAVWHAMLVVLGAAISGVAIGKAPFSVRGAYVEGCSCMGVCPCELTGLMNGCQGLGAMTVASGTYMGKDLSGAKIAYAVAPGEWVRIYTQPKSVGQSAAVQAFARAVYSGFGKIESIRNARIQMTGRGGRYTVKVDGGKVASFTTVPVIGGDNRTPIVHANIKDPLYHSVMQGKTVSGMYHDGKRNFTLKGTNSYFNNRIASRGMI